MANGPVFLERQSYRRRRMMDAIRLLPLLGLALFMVPLLWPQPDVAQEGLRTSTTLRYLFGGWMALVCCGWLLWARTRHKTTTAQHP